MVAKIRKICSFLVCLGALNCQASDGWGGEQLTRRCKPVDVGLGRYIYVDEKQARQFEADMGAKDAIIRSLALRDLANHDYLNCCLSFCSGFASAALLFSVKQKQD